MANVRSRMYCSECNALFDDDQGCDCATDNENVKKNHNFVYIMSIKDQLKTVLEDFNLGEFLKSHLLNSQERSIQYSDISHGNMYRRFGNGKLLNSNALSLLMFTDGVPVFNSSSVSLWPIFLAINELPPIMRKNQKPNFELFF